MVPLLTRQDVESPILAYEMLVVRHGLGGSHEREKVVYRGGGAWGAWVMDSDGMVRAVDRGCHVRANDSGHCVRAMDRGHHEKERVIDGSNGTRVGDRDSGENLEGCEQRWWKEGEGWERGSSEWSNPGHAVSKYKTI